VTADGNAVHFVGSDVKTVSSWADVSDWQLPSAHVFIVEHDWVTMVDELLRQFRPSPI
jgi:ABC-type taurine transport system substrate-binding protein